jgi:putative lipoprotein
MKLVAPFLTALLAFLASPKEARAEDEWLGTDKFLHFGVSAALSGGGYAVASLAFDRKWERATTGAVFSLTLGATKELYDLAGHGDASWKDFTWDIVGTAVGTGIALLVDVAVSGSNRVESSDRPVGLAVRF